MTYTEFLDLVQSGTGLVLALFMWGHMFFVSSILLGKDAMWTVTKFFEGYFVFGRSLPWLVSMVVAGIFSLVVLHALLAKAGVRVGLLAPDTTHNSRKIRQAA